MEKIGLDMKWVIGDLKSEQKVTKVLKAQPFGVALSCDSGLEVVLERSDMTGIRGESR